MGWLGTCQLITMIKKSPQLLQPMKLMILLLFLVACSPTVPDIDQNNNQNTCTDPRPEICTAQYDPVCAGGVTYSNGCAACSDAAVQSYVQGACSETGREGYPGVY